MAAINSIGSTTTPRTELKGEMPQPAPSKRSFVPKHLAGVGATASADWANNAVTVSWKGVSGTVSLGRSMGAWPLRVEVSSVDTSDTRLMVDVQVLYTNGQRAMKHVSLRSVCAGSTTAEPTRRDDLDSSLNNVKLRYAMMNEAFAERVNTLAPASRLWRTEPVAQLKREMLNAYRPIKTEQRRLELAYAERHQEVPAALALAMRTEADKVEHLLYRLDCALNPFPWINR